MRQKMQVALSLVVVAAVVVGCAPLQAVPDEKTIHVGPYLVDCEGVAPQKCMQVRESPEADWTLFYDQIEGFEYEEGFQYRLTILEEEVENPPADASSIRWVLVEVLEKSRSLEGSRWALDSYLNAEGILVKAQPGSEASVEFREGRVGGNASCNSFFGSYTVEGENLSIELGGMTEMYCAPEEVMAQEQDFLAALGTAASYAIVEDLMQVESSDGAAVLTFSVVEPLPLVGTTWLLNGYNNGKGGFSSLLDGTEISALFAEGGELGGSAGCNNYATSFEVDGSAISIGPVASTMMACPAPEGIMEQESAYLAALEAASVYDIDGNVLQMLDSGGTVMLSYVAQGPVALGGSSWQVLSYNNGKGAVTTPLAGTEITLSFGVDGRLAGSAGCNNYFAPYGVDGDLIEIGPVGSTMMMCSDPEGIMDQESAYLAALEASRHYMTQGDQLRMSDGEGATTLLLAPRESTSLFGTMWQAVAYNNGRGGVTSLLAGTEITAVFGEDGRLTGLASCNNYSAAFEVSGNRITIGPAATTRKFCAEPDGIMEQEAAYLAALQSAATYRVEGDRLEMWDASDAKQADYVVAEAGGALSDQALANMEYQSQFTASGKAPLRDGEYREQAAPGSATEIVVMLTEHVAHGELDGQPSAAVVLVTDPGGSGTFYDLAVVMEQSDAPVNVATVLLGDRVQVSVIAVQGNEIIVEMVEQGPDDPMCCPTQKVIKTFGLEGDELIEVSSQVAN